MNEREKNLKKEEQEAVEKVGADPEVPMSNSKAAAQAEKTRESRNKKEGDEDEETVKTEAKKKDGEIEYPATVDILGEKVKVASNAEHIDAIRIIITLPLLYGVVVDSQKGVDAIKDEYEDVPKDVKDKLETKEWEYKELAALERALKHFKDMLGIRRGASKGKKDKDQEITSVSKVDQAIDEDSEHGKLDHTTLGEYFGDNTNFSMFTAGTNSKVDFDDSDKQLEGTAVHEIAHGIFAEKYSDYATALEYWDDEYTASGKSGAEEPITEYGKTNAHEDIAEAVMYYCVERATLQSKCPKRYKLIKGYFEAFGPAKKLEEKTAKKSGDSKKSSPATVG